MHKSSNSVKEKAFCEQKHLNSFGWSRYCKNYKKTKKNKIIKFNNMPHLWPQVYWQQLVLNISVQSVSFKSIDWLTYGKQCLQQIKNKKTKTISLIRNALLPPPCSQPLKNYVKTKINNINKLNNLPPSQPIKNYQDPTPHLNQTWEKEVHWLYNQHIPVKHSGWKIMNPKRNQKSTINL